MNFRWPLVWRSRVDMLERIISIREETIDRLRKERDEQMARADRAIDQLAITFGTAPVTTEARGEMKTILDRQLEEQEKIVKALARVDADLASDADLEAQMLKQEQGVN